MARIEIYARLRPTNNRFSGLKTSPSHVSVQIGKLREDGHKDRFAKAPGARHDFKFSRTFEERAAQGEVFDTVVKKIVDQFVEGYNGTVFAYGQTSTGKTYTVEGSARQYEERGLVPRTLSYLYDILERKKLSETPTEELDLRSRSQVDTYVAVSPSGEAVNEEKTDCEMRRVGREVKVHISYMEIYQDTGYDLLNPGTRPGSLMLTLPKVQISEDANGRVVVRDLSLHEAATEQVALSLLFQGSTCRKVAETAMNQSSSRSHSIFTIAMTTTQSGSEVILRSKLHLVDLAGSERVSKTGSDGHILQEAKHINLSLHHLEHVIVTLQNQARSGRSIEGGRQGHIPYRNSMLTMVLKDSLGGNCLTAMIATVSGEEANIWETISTLRFSQRVACISNRASRNEELDDKAVIRKLKRRVTELERELTILRETKRLPSQMAGTDPVDEDALAVSETERGLCHRVLYDFFHGRIQNPVEAGINTPTLFQECLQVLRGIVIQAVKTGGSSPNAASPTYTTTVNHSQRSNLAETITSAQGIVDGDCGRSDQVTRQISTEVSERGGGGLRSSGKRSKKRRSRTKEHHLGSQSCDSNSHPLNDSPRQRLDFTQTPPQNVTRCDHSSLLLSITPDSSSHSKSSPLSLPVPHTSTSTPSRTSSSPVYCHPHTVTPAYSHTSHTTPPPTAHSHTHTPTLSQSHTSPLVTPVPTSRLSSGFGSLQEEEDVMDQLGSTSFRKSSEGRHGSLVCNTPREGLSIHDIEEPSFETNSLSQLADISRTFECAPSRESHSVDSSTRSSDDNKKSRRRRQSSNGNRKTQAETNHTIVQSMSAKEDEHSTAVHGDQSVSWARRAIYNHTTPSKDPIKSPSVNHFDPVINREDPSSSPQSQCDWSTESKPMKTPSSSGRLKQSQSSGLSPEDRAMQQLQEGTERLQKSQEKKEQLTGDVQLLSLRVEEEELKTQLRALAEQLASQHARILRYQQQASSERHTSSHEMCTEKIAEQQLRIKQARLHQKFLGVQQQIKSLQTTPSSRESKTLHISQSPISPTATRVSVRPSMSPPRASIAKMENDVAHTELSHSRVQKEIEQLRASQAEKQLELKEVATRRKLEELKQQLLHSNATLYTSLKGSHQLESYSPMSHSAEIPHSQSVIQPCTHSGSEKVHYTPPATAPQSQPHKQNSYASRQRALAERLTESMAGSRKGQEHTTTEVTLYSMSHSSSRDVRCGIVSPIRDEKSAQELVAKFSGSGHTEVTATTNCTQPASVPVTDTSTASRVKKWTAGDFHSSTSSPKNFPPYPQYLVTNNRDKSITSLHHVAHNPSLSSESLLKKTGNISARKIIPSPPLDNDNISAQNCLPNTVASNNSFKQTLQLYSDSRESRMVDLELEKKRQNTRQSSPLRLPEEMKEKEYMSAVEKRRARVSRIRRCIAAATVIQRAWRMHKERCA